ncbi:MAG: hypothetical protein KDK54_21055 [Leptospiraceae bacterium]|nr:hypothetical protein [Leptospiraceae bacterium]
MLHRQIKLFIIIFSIAEVLNCNYIQPQKNNDTTRQNQLLVLGALSQLTTSPSPQTIGGSLTGFSLGLVLQNNNGDDLPLNQTGSFAFSQKSTSYSVSVKSVHPSFSCTITNGSGTATSTVSNVIVDCGLKALSISGIVTTFTGTKGTSGSADGTGTAATFKNPVGVVSDGTNLFVCDSYNHAIRKIIISTGAVTTLAGTKGTSGTADGTGTAATFNTPYGITTDGTNLYVAEFDNHAIRKIVISTGVVTTLAGTKGTSGTTDGTGTAATFKVPMGITTDGSNLYVADYLNSAIRKIVISTGVVTTLAGTKGASGSADGTGTAATFSGPTGITTDGTNLYVADLINHAIRKIVISTGEVTTLAGTKGTTGTADGTGTAATFNRPSGITTDGTNLYVTEIQNYSVRKIVISTGVVTTLAGTKGTSGSADGTGTSATFTKPTGITSDGINLYVADETLHATRKIE